MTRSRTTAAAGALALLAVLAAACSSSQGASPTATASPTSSPTPTAAASSSQSGAPASSIDLNQAKDLESLLPDQVKGQKLQKISLKGSQFLGTDASSNKEFLAMLTALGKTPNDVSVAIASGSSPAISLGAFRIAGADGNRILDEFKKAAEKSGTTVTFSAANIGGKDVQTWTDPKQSSQGPQYTYTKGDILFLVQSTDQAAVAEALSKLP
ncbi:MAG: hypothetical protein M3Y88_00175 [Chloroflexota bacterium]|nr:hypothetical protein [Chloroflexota bacterium]